MLQRQKRDDIKMNKRTLIIIAIVLGIIALGVGAYFAWKNRAIVGELIPELIEGTITPIEPKEERLKLISSREVVGYWVLSNGTSSDILYVAQNGNMVKIGTGDIEEIINGETFSGVRNVMGVKNGSMAMAATQSEGQVMYRVYDVIANEWLLAGGDASSLSPDGGFVASIVKGALANSHLTIQETNLIQADTGTSKEVLSFAPEGFDVSWIKNSELLLTQKPSADYISDMWKVDVKTKKLQKFLSGRGLMVQWSPLGDRALKFTTTEGRDHKLTIIDDKGVELMRLRFVTMPEKCAIMTPTQMYCAIPRDQSALSHAILPDDYLKRDIYFQDGIYQIDLTTGGIRAIFEEENPKIDATELTVLDDRMLFVNRYDRKLYSLNLQ